MGSNARQQFADLVEQYVASARLSAEASSGLMRSAQSVAYPQYDTRGQRRYNEPQHHGAQLCSATDTNNLYHDANIPNVCDGYACNQLHQENRQPFNMQYYACQATPYHLTSVDENPNRIPYDRNRERSMGCKNKERSQSSPQSRKVAKLAKSNLQDHNIIICDICKVSCAGDLPYKEHLQGKQHKKKEMAQKLAVVQTPPTLSRGSYPNQVTVTTNSTPSDNISQFIRCNICDVTCCGKESYESHLRGARHKKVLGLSKKLEQTVTPHFQDSEVLPSSSDQKDAQVSLRVLGAPVINFVKGGRLHTIDNMIVEIPENGDHMQDEDISSKNDSLTESLLDAVLDAESRSPITNEVESAQTVDDLNLTEMAQADSGDSCVNKESQDVETLFKRNDSSTVNESSLTGEYIKEITSEGKIIGYACTLCDCQFNNFSAKSDHLKGKRHRSHYNKKNAQTNNLEKTGTKRKGSERKKRKKKSKLTQNNSKKDTDDNIDSGNSLMVYQDVNVQNSSGTLPYQSEPQKSHPTNFQNNPHAMIQSPHIMTTNEEFLMKVLSIMKPKEQELEDLFHIVSTVEKALKLISDSICKHLDANLKNSNKINLLKGVIRVGVLPKKFIVANDKQVDLVLLCERWPTKKLLHQISYALPEKLKMVSPDDTYTIITSPQEARIMVHSCEHLPTDPFPSVCVTLTSPEVIESQQTSSEGREDLPSSNQDEEDASTSGKTLDETDCLKGLAEIRHWKWFENCVENKDLARMVIKLIRVLCRNSTVWCKLDLWTLEILVVRAITRTCEYPSLYEATKRLFEEIASGILLPFGVGLVDPCEEIPTEVSSRYSPQDARDLTREARRALREIACGKIESIFAIKSESQQ